MKLTQTDLIEAQSHALRYYMDTAPGGRLPGMTTDLTEKDRLSLAWFNAVTIILRKNGLLGADSPVLDLIQVDRDEGGLDTEGYDSAASND